MEIIKNEDFSQAFVFLIDVEPQGRFYYESELIRI